MVYIKEAHAIDSRSPITGGDSPLILEPVTTEERMKVAQQCMTALELKRIPTLVDEVDDGVGKAYAAWPDRLFLVGKDGRIAYAGGPGPFGFKPGKLEAAIKKTLQKTRRGDT